MPRKIEVLYANTWHLRHQLRHFKWQNLFIKMTCDKPTNKGRYHRLQSNQPKTRENIFLYFLLWPGIKSRTFQS